MNNSMLWEREICRPGIWAERREIDPDWVAEVSGGVAVAQAMKARMEPENG